MVSIRKFLLAGALAAAVGAPAARAGNACGGDACCAAPCTTTVCCTEWVPEKYQAKRTVYKMVEKQETYTAYKCECVPEKRKCTYTVHKPVMETKTVTREVCEMVPCVEERTVMKRVECCVPVTTYTKKWIDKGHYECCTVAGRKGFCQRISEWCKSKKDPCYCPPPPPCKTVKKWVPCKVCVMCPKTCYKKVCKCVPTTCKVTVCKPVKRIVKENVTVCKCVATQETREYEVMVMKKTPYKATRTVCTCVPTEETFTCTRLVPRTVQKQVPMCCTTSCCKPRKWLSRKSSCCGH